MTGSDDPITIQIVARDGRYTLRGAAGQDDPLPESIDGWLTVGETKWTSVICGTRWGQWKQRFRHCPALQNHLTKTFKPSRWLGERDLYCEGGSFLVLENYAVRSLDNLTTGSDWVRIRVSARGRQEAFDASDVTGSPIEHHLIEYWPIANLEEPRIILGPDTFGRNYLTYLT